MSKVKVVMNPAGVRALLNAPGVVADLDARAERIRAAAGPVPGGRHHPVGPGRVRFPHGGHA